MNYTSIEQSKKLLELGLNPESADMCYQSVTKYDYSGGYWEPTIKGSALDINYEDDIPCWSVGALLKLISNYSLRKMGSKYWITFYNAPKISPTPTHVIDDCNNEIEAVYEMVVWLLENGYIKKVE